MDQHTQHEKRPPAERALIECEECGYEIAAEAQRGDACGTARPRALPAESPPLRPVPAAPEADRPLASQLEGTTGAYYTLHKLPLAYLRLLPPHALRVLCHLMYRTQVARAKKASTKLHASHASIARKTGRTEKAARIAMRCLVDHAVVELVERGSSRHASVYRVARAVPPALDEEARQVGIDASDHVQAVPRVLIAAPDTLLPDPAFAVLLAHRRRAKMEGGADHRACVSEIALETGLSATAVKSALLALQRGRLLEQVEQGGGRAESRWRVCRLPAELRELGRCFLRFGPAGRVTIPEEVATTTLRLAVDVPKGCERLELVARAEGGWSRTVTWAPGVGPQVLEAVSPAFGDRRLTCELVASRGGLAFARHEGIEVHALAGEVLQVGVGALQRVGATILPLARR